MSFWEAMIQTRVGAKSPKPPPANYAYDVNNKEVLYNTLDLLTPKHLKYYEHNLSETNNG